LHKPIAVVIDSWDYPYNGTVVSTRRFVRALRRECSFRVFCTPDTDADSGSEGDDERKVEFPRLSLPGFNQIIESMKAPLAKPDKSLIKMALKECGLLHVQYPFFLGYSAIHEAKRINMPIICSFHIQPENLLMNLGIKSSYLAKLLYRLFIHFFYRHADLVLAPSMFAANLLKQHGLIIPVEVLSNGVPMHFLHLPRNSPIRAGQSDKYRILSVGRFAGEKRQDLILRAISTSVYKEEIELYLVGTGPKERELKNLAVELSVNVEIGSVDDEKLLALYSRADLFIHAGEIELEGMSVVEAMASGNTVLVSDSPDSATPSLMRDKTALFKNGCADDLSVKLDAFLADPDRRAKQGIENREWAGKFSHDESVLQLSNIYQRFISKTDFGSESNAKLEDQSAGK
jgi:1,2-diacylglycerol 3-alpha-glucosyltransferase